MGRGIVTHQNQTAIAGWYTDPGQPDRLRYFDGQAWTDEVRPPMPAPTYPVAPSSVDAQPSWAQVPPRRKQSSTTPGRVLVIVAVTFVTLWGIAGALHAVRSGIERANGAVPAAGRQLVLSTAVPTQVLARGKTTTEGGVLARAQLRSETSKLFSTLPGVTSTHAEFYGSVEPGAAAQGNGLIAVGWAARSAPFDQDAFVRETAIGMKEAGGTNVATIPVSDDARLACTHQVMPEGGFSEYCVWMRSGTGFVYVVAYDVTRDVAVNDAAGVVAQLASPQP